MNKQEWDQFLENVIMPQLSEDDWNLFEKGLEDWTGYIDHLEIELGEAHAHLTKFGVNKPHWSLSGRLVLLIDEPKTNVFESMVVKLLAVLADLARCCEELLDQAAREGWLPPESEAPKHAKMLLRDAETWYPGFGNLTVSYAADAKEVRQQVRQSLGMED